MAERNNELAWLLPNGQAVEHLGRVGVDALEQIRREVDRAQVDHLQTRLARQGDLEVLFLQISLPDQDLADLPALGLLDGEGLLDHAFVDELHLLEDLPQELLRPRVAVLAGHL